MANAAGWAFGSIEDDNVDDVIVILSNSWYGVALLQVIGIALLYFAKQFSLVDVLDPVLSLLAGYFLRARKSRALAVFLFLYGLLILANTAGTYFGHGSGGRNIILAAIIAWVGWRGIPATWVYQRRRCARMRWGRVIANSIVTAVVAFISIIVAAIGIGFTQGLGGAVSQASQDLSYTIAVFFPAALTMAGLTLRWPFTEPDAACPWPPKPNAVF